MQFFSELGSRIERSWKDQNYSEKAFPEIAAKALSEASLEKNVNPWEIVQTLRKGRKDPVS